jgi:hypothetical protein
LNGKRGRRLIIRRPQNVVETARGRERIIKSDEEARLEVFGQEERAGRKNESREGLEIK